MCVLVGWVAVRVVGVGPLSGVTATEELGCACALFCVRASVALLFLLRACLRACVSPASPASLASLASPPAP